MTTPRDRMRTLIREARLSVRHRGSVPAIVGEVVRNAAEEIRKDDQLFSVVLATALNKLIRDELKRSAESADHAEGLRAEQMEMFPPDARISQDPAWWQCRVCDHHAVCHGGAAPERHCRSCLHASPVQGGDWHCARHNAPLDRRDQEAGCAAHLYLPDFVAAEQIDAGEDWVSYRLPDNSVWRDGVAA